MNVDRMGKLLQRVESAANLDALGELVRDLGHELPRGRFPVVHSFCAAAKTTLDQVERIDEANRRFVAGALWALLELCAAHEAELRHNLDREEIRALAIAPDSQRILRELAQRERSLNDLASLLSIRAKGVRSLLKDLASAGLVVESPIISSDQTTRASCWQLTSTGRLVAPSDTQPLSQPKRALLAPASRKGRRKPAAAAPKPPEHIRTGEVFGFDFERPDEFGPVVKSHKKTRENSSSVAAEVRKRTRKNSSSASVVAAAGR